MHAALARRVDKLVECGWEPHATTETITSLIGRRPFSWWLFPLVVVFLPLFGGIAHLIFWLTTSRATVFLHAEGDEVEMQRLFELGYGRVIRGEAWETQKAPASQEEFLELIDPRQSIDRLEERPWLRDDVE